MLNSRNNSKPVEPGSCRLSGMHLKRVPDRCMQPTRTLFTLRLSLVSRLSAFQSPQLRADVIITSPPGATGTALIASIEDDFTTFGLLSQIQRAVPCETVGQSGRLLSRNSPLAQCIGRGGTDVGPPARGYYRTVSLERVKTKTSLDLIQNNNENRI